MEMRCLKENVLMDWRVGSGQSQAVVEGEITLPGGLREEARVLYAGGMAVLSGETMKKAAEGGEILQQFGIPVPGQYGWKGFDGVSLLYINEERMDTTLTHLHNLIYGQPYI